MFCWLVFGLADKFLVPIKGTTWTPRRKDQKLYLVNFKISLMLVTTMMQDRVYQKFHAEGQYLKRQVI